MVVGSLTALPEGGVKGPAVTAGYPADDLLLGVEGVAGVLLLALSSIPSSSPPVCARTETTGVEPKVIPPPRPSSFGRPCNCWHYFLLVQLGTSEKGI